MINRLLPILLLAATQLHSQIQIPGPATPELIQQRMNMVARDMQVVPTKIGGDKQKFTFVIRHKAKKDAKAKGIGIILPGGFGDVAFLPFCANLFARRAYPNDWIVVELVAPIWGKRTMATTVWPSKTFKLREAKFDTEEFIKATIEELSRDCVPDAPVILQAWSSSGHAAISATLEQEEIDGILLCSSRSPRRLFKPESGAKGKSFFLYHSPDDRVTVFSDPQAAVKFLPDMGARAKLVTFRGGHGWPATADHAANLRKGIEWILEGRLKKAESKSE